MGASYFYTLESQIIMDDPLAYFTLPLKRTTYIGYCYILGKTYTRMQQLPGNAVCRMAIGGSELAVVTLDVTSVVDS